MQDQSRRFQRWREALPGPGRYLVDQVLTRLVPEFESRGFRRYADFAGGNPSEIGANEIPLQRREGAEWPTVQITFDARGRPFFHVSFASLPHTCRRAITNEPVDRAKAVVVYAPAHFRLCKGRKRTDDCLFGYVWFAWSIKRRIDKEVAEAGSLLPVVFDIFDTGIPKEWLGGTLRYVQPHVKLMGSWDEWRNRS